MERFMFHPADAEDSEAERQTQEPAHAGLTVNSASLNRVAGLRQRLISSAQDVAEFARIQGCRGGKKPEFWRIRLHLTQEN
jgi:hypothetical protein